MSVCLLTSTLCHAEPPIWTTMTSLPGGPGTAFCESKAECRFSAAQQRATRPLHKQSGSSSHALPFVMYMSAILFYK